MGVLDCIRHWPSSEARQWAETFRAGLCQNKQVDAIVAVGSAVRPIAHQASDVDFLLIYHGKRPELGTPPIDVDVRAMSRDEVEEKMACGHDVLGGCSFRCPRMRSGPILGQAPQPVV
jgi:hypothetical protein